MAIAEQPPTRDRFAPGPESATGNYRPIDDYALIGDCRSAALVSRDGSIDWLCWPRFDSPSLFAALLDDQSGGRFRIRPVGEFQTERRYLKDTNVLETVFLTAQGSLSLRDLMPVAGEADKNAALTAEHEILRAIEGISGSVELEITYTPRPDYARKCPPLERRGELGIWSGAGSGALVLRSEIPLEIAADRLSATGHARIDAGQRRFVSLTYSQVGPAVIPTLGDAAQHRLDLSIDWWQGWSAGCTYQGHERDAVIRSALALKLMTFAPSGAVIAAPTTSLPEWLGGAAQLGLPLLLAA